MNDFRTIEPGSWVEIPEGYQILIRDIDDIAHEAAQAIVRDLRDRSGIGIVPRAYIEARYLGDEA